MDPKQELRDLLELVERKIDEVSNETALQWLWAIEDLTHPIFEWEHLLEGQPTAKEELRSRVERMTDAHASMWLPLFDEVRNGRPVPFTVEQMNMIKRGLIDVREGRTVPHEEVMQRLGVIRTRVSPSRI